MEDLLPVQQNQSSAFTRLLSAFIDFSRILTGESFTTQSSTTFVRQRDVLVQGHRWDLFTIQVHENTQQTRAAAAGYSTQNPLVWLLKVANTQHVHHCQRLLKNEEHGSARARLGTYVHQPARLQSPVRRCFTSYPKRILHLKRKGWRSRRVETLDD